MPPKKKSAPEARTEAYVHPKASRTNNPDAGLHSADKVKVPPRVKYQYDPHLDPQLIWASKAERSEIEVETVSLHKHEIIRPQDVLSMVQGERAQGELFGDVRLPIHKAVEFYKHDQTWMNRMVLGDSLLVMNSLLHKEHLGGKVQMIYIDPPYGIAYNSNFQPRIDKREVQDGKDASLSREPEQIKAYRDTWTLGIHSYLSYLRDRLLLARELLTESGSIFVQISDENVHRVRMILDEIFDSDNFIATITFAKTSGSTEKFISQTNDFILWFAKSAGSMKYRALYLDKEPGAQGGTGYTKVELADGSRRGLSAAEKSDNSSIPPGAKIYTLDNITSQSIGREKGEGAACWFPVELNGRRYLPPEKARWKTNESGMIRLASERRIDSTSGGKLGYVRYLSDFPYFPLGASWTDTIGQNQTGGDKLYVVQTALKAVQRCLLDDHRPW
jgi:adenine-specific DNA-methyltransferase